MKWLILIMLISCGKHEEPKGLDFYDSDGDQVLNYEEDELGKYVANFETYDKISGVLRLSINDVIELPFSNEVDLNSRTLDLLTGNNERTNFEHYFSEWSKLQLQIQKPVKDLKLLYYQGYLYFEQKLDPADEVVLMMEKGSVPLGDWKPNMTISLTREQIELLSVKKAFLAIKKKFKRSKDFDVDQDNTIQTKTYRVYLHDGKASKILYVAKDLGFSELLKILKVKATELSSEEELFFNTNVTGNPEWIYRELLNGDKVLAYSDMDHLRDHVKKFYHYQKKIISRENGYSAEKIKLENKTGAKVFLKIRSIVQTTREFYLTTDRKRHGSAREGISDCTHHLRYIKSESAMSLHLTYLLQNFPVTGMEGALILEQMDNQGVFWELKLNSTGENTELAILPKTPDSYLVTGEYSNSCHRDALNRGTHASYKTNPEGKLSIEVESYVEKIQ